jgi:hypothetical protein
VELPHIGLHPHACDSAIDQGSQMEEEMRRMRQYGKAVGEGTLRCTLRTQNHICKTEALIMSHVRYPLETAVIICTTRFNIQKFYVPNTEGIYVFCMNSELV